jgi:hypothetical protein
MRWARHVARGERRSVYRTLVGKTERGHLDHLGVDGRIILRWIFRKWDVRALTGMMWLRTGTDGGHLWT